MIRILKAKRAKTVAKNLKFKLNVSGINELMKSPEMEEYLQEVGEEVARAAGPEYAARTHKAGFTSICNVYPNSKKAAKENYKENTLIKAIGALGLPMRKPKQ